MRTLFSNTASRLALAASTLAGAASVAPTRADGAIVEYMTPIAVPNNNTGVYINFATGANGTTAGAGWDFNPYSQMSTLGFYWAGAGVSAAGLGTLGSYADLLVGTVVSGATVFNADSSGAATSNLRATSGVHILGFRFQNEAAGGQVQYGYAFVQTTSGSGFPATILGWRFEDTGAPITVAGAPAAVPEPSTWLGGIAAGALAVRAWRRRKVT